MKLKISMVLYLISATSFFGQNINDGASYFEEFPDVVKVDSFESTFISGISQIDSFVLYNDSLLLCKVPKSKYHLRMFDLKNKKDLGQFVSSGRKDQDVLGFISYGVWGDNIWFYDIMKDEIAMTSIKEMLKGDYYFKKNSIPYYYYSVQILDDSVMLSSGNYNSNNWLSYLDLKKGVITKELIPYKSNSSDNNLTKVEKTANESILFLKPNGDKCVLAARYSDRIQIVDLNTEKSKITIGPKINEPAMVVMEDYDGQDMSARGPKTKYAFVQGTTTDKCIYLLHSGNQHQGEHRHYGKEIYIYDWSGNPLKKIKLPEYAVSIAVTSDDKTIYYYSVKHKEMRMVQL